MLLPTRRLRCLARASRRASPFSLLLLGAYACAANGGGAADGSGGGPQTGGSASGGASPAGSGGTSSGATSGAVAGLGSGGAGTGTGSSGSASGGATPNTGGSTNPNTGGSSSGGASQSTGGSSSGGANPNTGGTNGGASAGASTTGGTNAGASTMGGAAGANGGSAGRGASGGGGSTSTTPDAAYDAIYSGSPWQDADGKLFNAHAAGIVKDAGKYYLFGEQHSDTSNAFTAFNCYSSSDLANWKLEGAALTTQASGILGPERVGERAKVMKCPSTGEYVMLIHTDNLTYTDEAVGYATSPTINGKYTFKGALQFSGSKIARWDMGTFQDTDGRGYLLVNGGDIYQLADDYHSAATKIASPVATGGESPAMFKAGNTYFLLFSNRTSWERNDNFYYTATSVNGPWTSRGKFTPSGSLTWNSQTTFVFPVTGSSTTTYVFMGDRWSYPRQGTAATYVWQPATVSGTTLSIPTLLEAWRVDPVTGAVSTASAAGMSIDDGVSGSGTHQFAYSGNWSHTSGGGYQDTQSRSATSGDAVTIAFTGTRIKLYGVATPDGGYASFALQDGGGKVVAAGTLDFYSAYRDTAHTLKYVSPALASSSYTLKVTVAGAHSTWSDKAGTVYGSTGNFVSIDRAVISN